MMEVLRSLILMVSIAGGLLHMVKDAKKGGDAIACPKVVTQETRDIKSDVRT